MKITILLCSFCILFFNVSFAFAQVSTNSAGGTAMGSQGTAHSTLGQVFYGELTGSNGSVNIGVQQPFEVLTSIDNMLNAKLSVSTYPNPVKDVLILDIENFKNETYTSRLTDLNGREIQQLSVDKKTTQFDFSHLAKGTYVLSLIDNNQNRNTYKIIKN
jgi:hypothetical protein